MLILYLITYYTFFQQIIVVVVIISFSSIKDLYSIHEIFIRTRTPSGYTLQYAPPLLLIVISNFYDKKII